MCACPVFVSQLPTTSWKKINAKCNSINFSTQTKKCNGQSFKAVIVQTGSLDPWAKFNLRAGQGRAGQGRAGQANRPILDWTSGITRKQSVLIPRRRLGLGPIIFCLATGNGPSPWLCLLKLRANPSLTKNRSPDSILQDYRFPLKKKQKKRKAVALHLGTHSSFSLSSTLPRSVCFSSNNYPYDNHGSPSGLIDSIVSKPPATFLSPSRQPSG